VECFDKLELKDKLFVIGAAMELKANYLDTLREKLIVCLLLEKDQPMNLELALQTCHVMLRLAVTRVELWAKVEKWITLSYIYAKKQKEATGEEHATRKNLVLLSQIMADFHIMNKDLWAAYLPDLADAVKRDIVLESDLALVMKNIFKARQIYQPLIEAVEEKTLEQLNVNEYLKVARSVIYLFPRSNMIPFYERLKEFARTKEYNLN